jgi:hypothetical protein
VPEAPTVEEQGRIKLAKIARSVNRLYRRLRVVQAGLPVTPKDHPLLPNTLSAVSHSLQASISQGHSTTSAPSASSLPGTSPASRSLQRLTVCRFGAKLLLLQLRRSGREKRLDQRGIHGDNEATPCLG